MTLRFIFLSVFFYFTIGQKPKILMIFDENSRDLDAAVQDILKNEKAENFDFHLITSTLEEEEYLRHNVCDIIKGNNALAIVDATSYGWIGARRYFEKTIRIPYIRLKMTNNLMFKAMDSVLLFLQYTDICFVEKDEKTVNETIFFVMGRTNLRVTGTDIMNQNAAYRLNKMRPSTTNYVSWGQTSELMDLYEQASSEDLLKRDVPWNFIFFDFNFKDFNKAAYTTITRFFSFDLKTCCGLDGDVKCDCLKWPKGANQYIAHTFIKVLERGLSNLKREILPKWDCESPQKSSDYIDVFHSRIFSVIENEDNFAYNVSHYGGGTLFLPLTIDIFEKNQTTTIPLGQWRNHFILNENFKKRKIKKTYRVGMVMGLPWVYFQFPNGTKSLNRLLLHHPSKPKLEGYFPSLLDTIQKRMDFNYELVLSRHYGARLPNGTWSGIMKKLVSGEIDVCLANLIMTTEREEVIDFITPYIDKSGISIIVRKKKSTQSIFKFMTVLKLEVWLGTLIAVGVITILVWWLDRFSPYSYYNNRDLYPEGGRDFTFGESLWFAVTSLTPQGGGECPKALSGRILVAAYWLFIVLMLATFTSNLAAFLTVERLEKNIQSLDELIRHPKISYTVVNQTIVHDHFINMANAENIIFEKWKNLTLNSGSQTQSEFRVWDYPIQEQYFHILQVINKVGTVASAQEGFDRVEASTDGDFAFLHDSLEMKFHYYENCNFVLVGDIIAEQPVSIAVQQGSRLKKPMSKLVLSMQKERYFEKLTKKYWDTLKREQCPVIDESQGITLRSLGGIFLAALVGLALSMGVLAVEVWQQKREDRKQKRQKKSSEKVVKIGARRVKVKPMVNSGIYTENRLKRKSRSFYANPS